MKNLLLIMFLFIGLVSFQTQTEYEKIISGHPIQFTVLNEDDGKNYSYTFYQRNGDDVIYQLEINFERDAVFALYAKVKNKQIFMKNTWGEFKFYFDDGELYKVVQEIYKNEYYNIHEKFEITFDL